ncbi:MAG: hypothetical protein ACTHJQ_07250 [Rhizobiaceae bacterium]
MTTRDDDNTIAARRRLTREMLRSASPLPPPEEVFADWLLSVPHGADLAAAARRQIALIDRRMPSHPDVQCLRMLLVAVAGDSGWRRPLRNL